MKNKVERCFWSVRMVVLSLFCVAPFLRINARYRLDSSFYDKKDSVIYKTISFRYRQSVLDDSYLNNALTFRELDTLFADGAAARSIDSIIVLVSVSPDGDLVYNKKLANNRSVAIREYLNTTYPEASLGKTKAHFVKEDWDGLRNKVLVDLKMPFRNEVLHILDRPIGPLKKQQMIRLLQQGKVWNYMMYNYMEFLRTGAVCMVYCKMGKPNVDKTISLPEDKFYVSPGDSASMVEGQPEEVRTECVLSSYKFSYKRPVAVKTNLLFDLATALNVEVEVPVASRWSIAGEWIFPWWLWENKQNSFEVLSGNIEARYWLSSNFKKQEITLGKHNPLAGWFVGLYGGGGLYDLEWNKKGYQGEFFIATGISAGYVHPLSRHLSMEFSLGVGYMKTDYRYYVAEFSNIDNDWHLIRQHNGSYSWIGPTRAKVSLVWYPHFKSKKRR